MRAAGRKAFEARDSAKTAAYSSERDPARLDKAAEVLLKANAAAWTFFKELPPGYRRTVIWWVVSAKREETRTRRLDALLVASAARRRIFTFS